MKTISCNLLPVFFSFVLFLKEVQGKPNLNSISFTRKKHIKFLGRKECSTACASVRAGTSNHSTISCFQGTFSANSCSVGRHTSSKTIDRNRLLFHDKERKIYSSTFSRNQYVVGNTSNSFASRRRTRPLNMALVPIPVETLDKILTSGRPTPAQYKSYSGRTSREQYNAGFEAFGVAFLGVFAAYFASFAIGQFVATIMGAVSAAWFLIGPELKAYQRNWELTSGRDLVDPWIEEDDDRFDIDEDKRGLYGAFYLGRIEDVCVVEFPSDLSEDEYSLDDFEDYTMEKDDQEREIGIPYSLRLRVTDSTDFEEGRELQVHTRMSEDYLDLEVGMPVCAVLLSTSQRFQSLSAITDFCVPDAGPCWVGDYPYLDRPELEKLFVKDEELWDCLRDEGRYLWDINNLES